MKPFLVLQLRPESEASDNEFEAFLEKGGLDAARTRRVRLDREDLPSDLDLGEVAGVIVGGGPGCVSDPPEKKSALDARMEAAVMSLMPEITARDVPFLGCCYGIGILAHHLGARVGKGRFSEPVGSVTVHMTAGGRRDPILDGLPESFGVLVGHKEAVEELPEGAVQLLSSEPCPFQMIRFRNNVYATQFHPEADAQVFATRIRIYKDFGYFPPEQAESLIGSVDDEDIRLAPRILRNFVSKFS